VINPSLNVRFTEAQLTALREIGQKNGVNVSHLVRWAVDGLIRHVERNEGRLVLPIEYAEPKKPTSQE
jgi:predicted site-specific integrase-resolvase